MMAAYGLQSKTLYVLASEIPVISDVFKLDPFSYQIIDELDKNDYYTDNIDFGVSLFPGCNPIKRIKHLFC